MKQYHGLTAEMYRAVIAVVDERMEAIRVTREDFDRLNRTVGELAQAQRDLAQAQARTEERLEELAQAQARTEERVGGLETAMQQLAQAQARTEERVRQLEEGHIALQQGQAALQQGQAAMQKAIQRLAEAQARTEVALGSLAENIGFGLEDIARLLLPAYLPSTTAFI